ncbi:MAG: hypothetical protein P1Q69_18610 [Candidatus Thorarchaeota archaeon]|nr:hypothetical protein [Candidatus Thorarchaeota archaeon]
MDNENATDIQTRFMKPEKVTVIFIMISLSAPYQIAYSSSLLAIAAMLWVLNVTSLGFSIDVQNNFYWYGTSFFFIGLPQFIFSYFMYRFYQKRTSKSRLIHVGLIGTLPIIFWGIMNGLPRLWDPYYPYGFNMLPIPVILIFAYLFLKRYSPPPIKDDETHQWLDSDK